MKRYLITGASRGIGRAIAEKLAENNVTLFLHGRDVAALRETTNLVEANGAISRQLRADLGDKSSIRALIEQVSGEPLDALINNAGIAVVKPLDKISIEEWERTFAINVTAPFLLSQGLIPAMSQGGSIVNILSIAAKARAQCSRPSMVHDEIPRLRDRDACPATAAKISSNLPAAQRRHRAFRSVRHIFR